MELLYKIHNKSLLHITQTGNAIFVKPGNRSVYDAAHIKFKSKSKHIYSCNELGKLHK